MVPPSSQSLSFSGLVDALRLQELEKRHNRRSVGERAGGAAASLAHRGLGRWCWFWPLSGSAPSSFS